MKILYILCLLNIVLTFGFLFFKKNDNTDLLIINERFENIETQLTNTLNHSQILTLLQTNKTTKINKPTLDIEQIFNLPFSVAFLKGKPSVNFGNGSSAIYFIGEFCPYGKILTITPNRILCKSGNSFNMVLPLYDSSSLVDSNNLDSSQNQEESSFSKPNFDFFGSFK